MKKRYLVILILVMLLIPKVALADMGPKSSVEIEVKNAPSGTYYLDLLVSDTGGMNAVYDPNGYKEELYRMLWDYSEDGYRAALVHQSEMWGVRGSLTDHSFVQAPSEFKIIIVSKAGIRVSEVYRRARFSDAITIDYSTMEITSANKNILLDWLLQFLQTYSSTILIEGIVLLLFGFKLKENWKPFLIVNLITQVILIVSMGLTILYWGAFAYILLFLIVEALIVVMESLAYKKLLRREKAGGRVAYAVTANLLSLLASFVLILLSSPM